MNKIKLLIRKIKHRHYGTPYLYDLIKNLNPDDEKTVTVIKSPSCGHTMVFPNMAAVDLHSKNRIDPDKERLTSCIMEKNGFKEPKHIWKPSEKQNVLYDFDSFRDSILELVSISAQVPIEMLKRPYTGHWRGFHLALYNKFGYLTEYDGFLTEA